MTRAQNLTDNRLSLTSDQLTMVEKLRARGRGHSHLAYDYIFSVIKNIPNANRDVVYWFQQARHINNPRDDSQVKAFIYAVTNTGFAIEGRAVTSPQIISDHIGELVINDILDLGYIPEIPNLVGNDILAGVERFGQTLGGWGGAFYYWNVEYLKSTVGREILKDGFELEKFLHANAMAVLETFDVADLNTGNIWEALTASMRSGLPQHIFNEILVRIALTTVSARPTSNCEHPEEELFAIGRDGSNVTYAFDRATDTWTRVAHFEAACEEVCDVELLEWLTQRRAARASFTRLSPQLAQVEYQSDEGQLQSANLFSHPSAIPSAS